MRAQITLTIGWETDDNETMLKETDELFKLLSGDAFEVIDTGQPELLGDDD